MIGTQVLVGVVSPVFVGRPLCAMLALILILVEGLQQVLEFVQVDIHGAGPLHAMRSPLVVGMVMLMVVMTGGTPQRGHVGTA